MMLEKHLQPRWHAAADLLFSPAPFEIHPHHMKARCAPLHTLLCFGWPTKGLAARQPRPLRQCVAETDDSCLDAAGVGRDEIWVCLKMLCTPFTQWFCWSLSPLNGYNWEYTLFSDTPICSLRVIFVASLWGSRYAGGLPTSKAENDQEVCGCLESSILSRTFLLDVWVRFKVVPWRTEHILTFHLLKCGCTQISDYFVVFVQGAATRCQRLRKVQLQVASLRDRTDPVTLGLVTLVIWFHLPKFRSPIRGASRWHHKLCSTGQTGASTNSHESRWL